MNTAIWKPNADELHNTQISVFKDKINSTFDLKLATYPELYEWSIKWKMIFNPGPTKPAEEIKFTNKNTSYENVLYSGVEVLTVDNHKHLGYILDSKINYI